MVNQFHVDLRKIVTVCALASVVMVCGVRSFAQAPADMATADDIRNKLLRLPYYGVFDFLAFSYSKGTVTLTGYASSPTLKTDAERAVKQVARVDRVVDSIETLPASDADDALRWRAYYAIYNDPFLARYAVGSGTLWGHRHGIPMTLFGSAALFPGVEPVGTYPIVIIVKNGHITLMGIVDSQADKDMAGMKVDGLPGSFGVENQLTVEAGRK